jgi:RimJ/RimL family protein N-acetyltransferase
MPGVRLPDPPLGDRDIVLRAWRPSDVPALTAACQDPEIPRWTAIPSPYRTADARAYLRRADRDRRTGRELGLAIVDAETGELLGSCGLARLDWDDRKVEIGYWVAVGARRRGVGTRAVRLLSCWALDQLAMERIELLANPANEPSQRLAHRAGFTREGLLRAYRRRKGRREDLVMFSLLARDPAGRPATER